MTLQFVPAEESDIPVIFEQARNLIDAYEDIDSIDYDKVLAWVKRKIRNHICEYQCVIVDGERCGYYRLCADGELDDLYVLPKFQNRGIGSHILNKCIHISEKPVYLYVFIRNTRAIALYERFGFIYRESVGTTRAIMSRKG